jgi:hypothetical protein
MALEFSLESFEFHENPSIESRDVQIWILCPEPEAASFPQNFKNYLQIDII